ncbi:MAG: UDP-N-acetylmuramate dehydrogenase [Bacteroidales bacterium]|nr:UDP-N-acetylmuramate dehydrogenase [Candidatus Colimorpha merdihippi]
MKIYNTFGIPATASQYFEIASNHDLHQLLDNPPQQPWFILGGGSNVVFTRHYPGSIIHPANQGIRQLDPSADADTVLVEAAAGENWDSFVHHTITHGWYGAENLIAIPGTVGASPVQNVGAYGVEAKDIIHSVRAFHLATGQERIFTNAECCFGYRDSIFKNQLKDQYLIWSVTFKLSRTFAPNTQYRALADIQASSAQTLADAITQIRWSKLPRPEEMGSAGSFFKNPIVTPDHYQRLLLQYPDIVAFPVPEGYKLAAGWLIEKAGWKNRSLGPCGVYSKQALVLVNHGGCTGADVLALADAICADVRRLFGVALQKEAIIL